MRVGVWFALVAVSVFKVGLVEVEAALPISPVVDCCVWVVVSRGETGIFKASRVGVAGVGATVGAKAGSSTTIGAA